MGSQGRKRGRRTRSDEGGQRADITSGLVVPEYEHGQYTVEGYIERLGAFGRAGARATDWKRWVAVLIVIAILGPVVLSLIAYMVGALSR